MRYPANLWTLEIDLGLLEPLHKVYSHPDTAGADMRLLITRMRKSNGQIASVKLFHRNTLVGSYFGKPDPIKILPSPDSNGVRHIPEFGKHFSRAVTRLAPPAPRSLKPSTKI